MLRGAREDSVDTPVFGNAARSAKGEEKSQAVERDMTGCFLPSEVFFYCRWIDRFLDDWRLGV